MEASNPAPLYVISRRGQEDPAGGQPGALAEWRGHMSLWLWRSGQKQVPSRARRSALRRAKAQLGEGPAAAERAIQQRTKSLCQGEEADLDGQAESNTLRPCFDRGSGH